jgi:MFS family permease
MVRVLVVMTVAAATGNMLFNFATSGNTRLLAERLEGLVADPAALGALLAAVYALASFAQVLVGRLIDRFPMKPLYLSIVLVQVPLLAISSGARGWWHYAGLMLTMVFVFGAIPFIDTMVVRYVDDRMRSRVAGLRMGISFGISSLAVWLIGPVVKIAGFQVLWLAMAGLALATAAVVSLLPPEPAPLTAGR